MSYESWRITYQNSEQAARAAYEMAEKNQRDADRWRHARRLFTIDDIEGAQGAHDSFGGMVSEDECIRADDAIDAAINGANTGIKGSREAASP